MEKTKIKNNSPQPKGDQMESIMDKVGKMVGNQQEPPKPVTAPKPEQVVIVEQSSFTLEVPVDTSEKPGFRQHIDIVLQGDTAVAIRKIASALDMNRATLSNGRRCVGVNDAVRWMLENLALQIETNKKPESPESPEY